MKKNVIKSTVIASCDNIQDALDVVKNDLMENPAVINQYILSGHQDMDADAVIAEQLKSLKEYGISEGLCIAYEISE